MEIRLTLVNAIVDLEGGTAKSKWTNVCLTLVFIQWDARIYLTITSERFYELSSNHINVIKNFIDSLSVRHMA